MSFQVVCVNDPEMRQLLQRLESELAAKAAGLPYVIAVLPLGSANLLMESRLRREPLIRDVIRSTTVFGVAVVQSVSASRQTVTCGHCGKMGTGQPDTGRLIIADSNVSVVVDSVVSSLRHWVSAAAAA